LFIGDLLIPNPETNAKEDVEFYPRDAASWSGKVECIAGAAKRKWMRSFQCSDFSIQWDRVEMASERGVAGGGWRGKKS